MAGRTKQAQERFNKRRQERRAAEKKRKESIRLAVQRHRSRDQATTMFRPTANRAEEPVTENPVPPTVNPVFATPPPMPMDVAQLIQLTNSAFNDRRTQRSAEVTHRRAQAATAFQKLGADTAAAAAAVTGEQLAKYLSQCDEKEDNRFNKEALEVQRTIEQTIESTILASQKRASGEAGPVPCRSQASRRYDRSYGSQ
jgi:hypothetical protein